GPGGDGPLRDRHRARRAGGVRRRASPFRASRQVQGQPRGPGPQRHHGGRQEDPPGPRRARHQGGHHVPGRLQPAGAGERPAVLPGLPGLHRLGPPHRGERRDRGAARPSACQDVMHFDQVCYDFPELRIVMRHGAEPWEELAVKLMLKWPGLYYMTSAFAPKYYPKAIIDYANTRGTDKVMYAGYFPMGLSLERIFTELRDVPFRDHVWPSFLRDNATRTFKLADA